VIDAIKFTQEDLNGNPEKALKLARKPSLFGEELENRELGSLSFKSLLSSKNRILLIEVFPRNIPRSMENPYNGDRANLAKIDRIIPYSKGTNRRMKLISQPSHLWKYGEVIELLKKGLIELKSCLRIVRSNVVDNLIDILDRLFENNIIKPHAFPVDFYGYAPSPLYLQWTLKPILHRELVESDASLFVLFRAYEELLARLHSQTDSDQI
jgi:hypothetical protein